MQCEMARQFFDMLTVITAKQKIPKEYADGQVLYNAEIELLEKIYQYPQANIRAASEGQFSGCHGWRHQYL